MSDNTPDRRSVIAGGMALAGSALLPSAGAGCATLAGAASPSTLVTTTKRWGKCS